MNRGIVLDNLILNVKNVTYEEYNCFVSELCLSLITSEWDSDVVQRYQKQRAREYHYNVQVGAGGGAAYIGYQHNSEKPNGQGYTLKLEFNPSKITKEQEQLRKIFFKSFEKHEILIKGGELALDVELSMDSIIPISLTGRCQDRHKGTIYFGSRGKHGYLKIYNKKKELIEIQNVEVGAEYLTRIEFSFRFEKAISFDDFNLVDLQIDKLYKISVVDHLQGLKIDPVAKACIYSYQNGFQDIKDFSRTYKNKIKNALESMEEINLDHKFKSAKREIILNIKNTKNYVVN